MRTIELAPRARNGIPPGRADGATRRRGMRMERLGPDPDPYADVVWTKRQALVRNYQDPAAPPVFRQDDVEFPAFWSQQAVDICASKYFRGQLGTPQRERSLRQLIDRVADTIADWGEADSYFAGPADAEAFRASLKWVLVNQMAAFNSPVWFNIGVPGVAQQASACFILSVEDTLTSIVNWWGEEAEIFRGGSGAGVNVSAVRADGEPLSGGGRASGPVSFMRAADAAAGAIRSGGKTRRAAKMVLLDADHPDVETFIEAKAREEDKARSLVAAGWDMDFDSADAASLSFQNANHSVRLCDEFMEAATAGSPWQLRGRQSSDADRTVDAADILDAICDAAHRCGDPGVQFSSTISSWHTLPNAGPITASNPCSEYMSVDDSACNLASVNVVSFLDGDSFDISGLAAVVRVLIVAQDILVDRADYPTAKIADNTRRFRQLGLGMANFGAALMRRGVGYGSEAGRQFGAAVCSLLCGEAYATSAELARALGPFAGFDADREAMCSVLDRHSGHATELASRVDVDSPTTALIAQAGATAWANAATAARHGGVRNAQATVMAPTGTISFMMDCDTTGMEPDLSLVKHKKLAGGGMMKIVNDSVPHALRRLGYDTKTVDAITAHLDVGGQISDPEAGLDPAHLPVFATATGDVAVSPREHVLMMAAMQVFVSGAISKTVNLPESATVADIRDLIVEAHRLGVKALAVFRDNCKVSQPLVVKRADRGGGESGDAPPVTGELVAPSVAPSADGATAKLTTGGVRRREPLPYERPARTFAVKIADLRLYVTVGEYPDGRPGEIFLRTSKQGSTLAGIMDALAISVSLGLQSGVPLSSYIAAFKAMRFEPSGMCDHPEIRLADSMLDLVAKILALAYLHPDEREALGIQSISERQAAVEASLPGMTPNALDPPSDAQLTLGTANIGVAPLCMTCGVQMHRSGACHVCPSCGTTSGCG